MVADPYTDGLLALSQALASALGVDPTVSLRWLLEPTKEEYGDASFPAIRFTRDVEGLAVRISNELAKNGVDYISAEPVQAFLNFRFDCARLARKLKEWARKGGRLEVPKVASPLTVVVEHTSANPIHPLHIGHARNACLGDSLARLLKARGHRVERRFYIDDMGRQVAIVALGFKLLGEDPSEIFRRAGIKKDRLVGWIYAVTSTTIDLVEAKAAGKTEEVEKLAAALVRLKSQDPLGAFEKLYNAVLTLNDPESQIANINLRYELGVEPERSLVRTIVEAVLEGFRESLARLGVEFDKWDWESDLVWGGLVGKLVAEAKSSPYYIKYKGADAIDIPKIISELVSRDKEAAEALKIPQGLTIPPLVLLRSDGTTLYTTRDLAYTIHKFSEAGADRVINVIGVDQKLPQLQLRLALLGLGYRKEALNLVHYGYEVVRLPTGSMHGRRGEYVTLDDVLDDVKARVIEELRGRSPALSKEELDEISEKVAVGAVRFALLQADASKPLVFDVNRAVNLKENSGPYLQYTYVRALSIMEKHGEVDIDAVDPAACYGERRTLLLKALKTPLIAAKAADDLAPDLLANHLLDLANYFNVWYEKDPVIREQEVGVREFKAMMVDLVAQAIGMGLDLLGIPRLRRM